METYASLVGTEGAVALHPEASVYPDDAPVVSPRDTENNDALRLGDSFENLLVDKIGIIFEIGDEAEGDFLHGLMKLGLSRVPGDQVRDEAVYILLCKCVHD